jgi:hypothetical protein
MKIKLLRSIGIDGKHTEAGTIVEAPRTLALELIGSSRAELVDDSAEAEVTTASEGAQPFLGGAEAPEDAIVEPAAPTRRKSRTK